MSASFAFFRFRTADADADVVEYCVEWDRSELVTFDAAGRVTARRNVTADASAPVPGRPFTVSVLPNSSPYHTAPVLEVLAVHDSRRL